MVTVTGREAVRAHMARLAIDIETKLLAGAARAGINLIADEARDRCVSDEVRAAIKTSVKKQPGRALGRCTADMGRWQLPIWLENGTSGHYVSVRDEERGPLSANRVNKNPSLLIGNNFVGTTVWHPGAQPHPFMRPALDAKEAEAITAAQNYINSRISRGRIIGSEDHGDG